jgi:YD repeat-containing protein
MGLFLRHVMAVVACLVALSCASCLTMTMPKTARVEPGSSPAGGASDKRIVDTWELLYQIDDKGDKQLPTDGTRTLIEFTPKGRVIFNRIDKDNSDRVKNRTGKYSQENNEIVITDDSGNNVRWTYNVQDDTLVITAPELKKTFHWRRFR